MGVEVFDCLNNYLGVERCKKSYRGKPAHFCIVQVDDASLRVRHCDEKFPPPGDSHRLVVASTVNSTKFFRGISRV